MSVDPSATSDEASKTKRSIDLTTLSVKPPYDLDEHVSICLTDKNELLIRLPTEIVYTMSDGSKVAQRNFCTPEDISLGQTVALLRDLGKLTADEWEFENHPRVWLNDLNEKTQKQLEKQFIDYYTYIRVGSDGLLTSPLVSDSLCQGLISALDEESQEGTLRGTIQLSRKFDKINIRGWLAGHCELTLRPIDTEVSGDFVKYGFEPIKRTPQGWKEVSSTTRSLDETGSMNLGFKYSTPNPSTEAHHQPRSSAQNDQVAQAAADMIDGLDLKDIIAFKLGSTGPETSFDEKIHTLLEGYPLTDSTWCTQVTAVFDPEEREFVPIPSKLLAPLTEEQVLSYVEEQETSLLPPISSTDASVELDHLQSSLKKTREALDAIKTATTGQQRPLFARRLFRAIEGVTPWEDTDSAQPEDETGSQEIRLELYTTSDDERDIITSPLEGWKTRSDWTGVIVVPGYHAHSATDDLRQNEYETVPFRSDWADW